MHIPMLAVILLAPLLGALALCFVPQERVEPHGQARGTFSNAPPGANIPPTHRKIDHQRAPQPRPGPDSGIEGFSRLRDRAQQMIREITETPSGA